MTAKGKQRRTLRVVDIAQLGIATNEMTDGEVMDLTRALVEYLFDEDMGPYTIPVSIKQALDNIDRKGPLKSGLDFGKAFAIVQVVRLGFGFIGVPKAKKIYENETTEFYLQMR